MTIEALNGRFDDHHADLARVLLDQIDACSEKINRLTTGIEQRCTVDVSDVAADSSGQRDVSDVSADSSAQLGFPAPAMDTWDYHDSGAYTGG